MTEHEISKYKEYVFNMTDEELDAETVIAVKNGFAGIADGNRDNLMLISLCHTEWRNRGQEDRLLKGYNTAIKEMS